MCYYGSQFPKGVKKDQGHFNLMSDLHTLVRNGQHNLFHGPEGKKELISHLSRLISNVQKGEYENLKTDSTAEVTQCTPEMSVN